MPRKISRRVPGKKVPGTRCSNTLTTTKPRPTVRTRIRTQGATTITGRTTNPTKTDTSGALLSLSGDFWRRIPYFPAPELKLQARRPDDLLVFTLTVKNLEVVTDGVPGLIKSMPNSSSTLIGLMTTHPTMGW